LTQPHHAAGPEPTQVREEVARYNANLTGIFRGLVMPHGALPAARRRPARVCAGEEASRWRLTSTAR
jgi:hypothetical protein